MAVSVHLTPSEEIQLQRSLSAVGPKEAAKRVLKLSDFYIQNPKAPTPWHEADCVWAYEFYFHTLNVLRLRGVFSRLQELQVPLSSWNVLDWGAGLGAVSASQAFRSVCAFEQHVVPRARTQAEDPHRLAETLQNLPTPRVAVFSYSLTELASLPSWTQQMDGLLILEPATREDGRRLLQVRQELLQKNWFASAPCTHQQACPLLAQSQKDWCHDRFHWEAPSFWQEFETHLPFRNPTLTVSYLFLTRNRIAPQRPARLVGDLLHEKGRSRILLCQDSEKRWLQFLHRKGTPPDLHRGDLLEFDDPNGLR